MIPSLSVVVPVFNSASTLEELVRRLAAVLPRVSESYELILVNDGSRDNSWAVVCRLSSGSPWVRGIDLMKNYGQHNAVLCGIRAARHDVIVTIDDDLQNPPEEIPKLVEALEGGAQVVYGTPRRQRHGLWRDIASLVTKVVLRGAMGAETATSVSPFRALRTEVRSAFEDFRAPWVNIDVLLTWGAQRFARVQVEHAVREAGRSNYTVRRLIRHALNMMTGFSTLPLRLASIVGFLFTVVGLGVLVWVLGRYFTQGDPVPGFPFLASIVAVFSGAQLFSLGIIGEYLARMYVRVQGEPSYIVSATAGMPAAAGVLTAGSWPRGGRE